MINFSQGNSELLLRSNVLKRCSHSSGVLGDPGGSDLNRKPQEECTRRNRCPSPWCVCVHHLFLEILIIQR